MPKKKIYSNQNVINTTCVADKNFHISSIAGKYKKFDNELCEKFDIPLRNKIKIILGDFVSDNPNLYEQDLIINNKNTLCKYKYLELQVCGEWVGTAFPRDNLYVFVRKARYSMDTLFLISDKFMHAGYIFNREAFIHSKPVRYKKYCKYFVYEIPISSALPIFIDSLDVDTFEQIY